MAITTLAVGYFILLSSGVFIIGTDAIHCLQCDKVSDLSECTEFVECPTDHACYTERYLSEVTQVPEYRAGCRNIHECKLINCNTDLYGIMTSSGRRRSEAGLVICTECCFSDSCNFEGCGGKFIDRHHTNVHCFTCRGLHQNETCHTVKQCQSTQIGQKCRSGPDCSYTVIGRSANMCVAEKKVGVRGYGYDLGCKDKQMCAMLRKLEEKGQAVDATCCGSDLCNVNPYSPRQNVTQIVDSLVCPTHLINTTTPTIRVPTAPTSGSTSPVTTHTPTPPSTLSMSPVTSTVTHRLNSTPAPTYARFTLAPISAAGNTSTVIAPITSMHTTTTTTTKPALTTATTTRSSTSTPTTTTTKPTPTTTTTTKSTPTTTTTKFTPTTPTYTSTPTTTTTKSTPTATTTKHTPTPTTTTKFTPKTTTTTKSTPTTSTITKSTPTTTTTTKSTQKTRTTTKPTPSTTTTTTKSTTTAPTPHISTRTTTEPAPCVDDISNCAIFGQQLCTNDAYIPKCKAYCKLC